MRLFLSHTAAAAAAAAAVTCEAASRDANGRKNGGQTDIHAILLYRNGVVNSRINTGCNNVWVPGKRTNHGYNFYSVHKVKHIKVAGLPLKSGPETAQCYECRSRSSDKGIGTEWK